MTKLATTTYIGHLITIFHHGARPVFLRFALDYLTTPEKLEKVQQDGKSLGWDNLDLDDFVAVKSYGAKRGYGAKEVLAALRARNRKNHNARLKCKSHLEPLAAHEGNRAPR